MRVTELPGGVQITSLLDGISPDSVSSVFNENLNVQDKRGGLKGFRCLDGGVLLALDGVWYHWSEQIHCDHCLHMTKDGVTTCYHSALAGTLVCPGNTTVLPLAPEMITNRGEETDTKQDCERNAAKRWLSKHSDEYTWLSETVKNPDLREVSRTEWNGRHHLKYTCRWLNGAQIRDNKETLRINYLALSIWNEEQNKQTFYNTWITNKAITSDNAFHLAACRRARWKIENGHNNVLKNHVII